MKFIPIKLNNKNQTSAILKKKIQISFERNDIGGFFNNKSRLFGVIACLISIIIQVFSISFFWNRLPTQVPLFYSLPWGNDVLSKPIYLWILPILTMIFALVNFMVIKSNIQNQFLSNILTVTLVIVCFMNAFGILKIITLLT